MHIVHLCSHKHLKDQKMLGELSVIVFEPLLKGVMSIISKKKKKKHRVHHLLRHHGRS